MKPKLTFILLTIVLSVSSAVAVEENFCLKRT